MAEERYLTLGSIFSYLNCNVESRCFVEGEALLNAKHIILIGSREETETTTDIFALCLQTSGIKSSPHEIKGQLNVADGQVSVNGFICSCKAGLFGTCKHIAAVLLNCSRSDLSSLEKLSSTDLKCYWTQTKKKVEEEYEARPLLEVACFAGKVQKTEGLSAERQRECFQELTGICKNSALTLHLKGRSIATCSRDHGDDEKIIISERVKKIIDCADNSQFLSSLDINIDAYRLKPCCRELVNNAFNLRNFHKTITCGQKSVLWHEERQLRITGSRCYSIYTFSKEDWATKAADYFWPKTFSNKYTEHGLKYESEALEKYKAANNYDVCQVRLVICRKYPWFAYSPDGILMMDGVPTRLVEIKCPYEGNEVDAIQFVHSCPYLEISADRGLTLKKRHPYYGQVQLGMAILNLPQCDLILYSSKSKSFLNINVPFDEDFTRDLIYVVSKKYFEHMLPFICKKTSGVDM